LIAGAGDGVSDGCFVADDDDSASGLG